MSTPLPAGVSLAEARLQELLLAGGHPRPLSEAAAIVRQDRAASGTERPVPAAQWSAGMVRPGHAHGQFRHEETAGRS